MSAMRITPSLFASRAGAEEKNHWAEEESGRREKAARNIQYPTLNIQ
jgi:hypothetical protein